jgi:2'-5' RNA ligase
VPRRRLGVALLVPPPVATEIDGLRRALGDGALGRIPAHMTLVPPVNVPEAAMTDAVAVLRDAARNTGPIDVRIGPAATFAPVTPVVYLAVGGDAEAVHAVHALRDRVFRPPLARTLTHPFVPHVTVADDLVPARIPSAVAALADFVVDVRIASVHLLEERRGHVWEPIAEAPFSRRRPSGPAVRNG